MRWTQTLIPTARQVPADAVVPSHQLMLRAGLIRQVGAGIYDFLPLGFRALQRAAGIVRSEMDAAGAVEVLMPAMIPMEFYADTKRDIDYGDNLFKLRDRHGRANALGPTHEEVITEMVKGSVDSPKQLPLNIYQIQTKYRDEYRPRFGLLRCREFLMKDAYSFHMHLEGPGGLDETYDKMYAAYSNIFSRAGLVYEVVEAESGPIGGSASHEFMCITPNGEDLILRSDKGDYAANVERCEIGDRPFTFGGAPSADLEKVHTPDLPGIEGVAEFLGVQPKDMVKNIVWPFVTNDGREGFIMAVVRGDHEVNEGKVRLWLADRLNAAVTLLTEESEDKARDAGFSVGYISPCASTTGAAKDSELIIVADPDAVQDHDWVTGADQRDYHVRHFNWKRDVLDQGIEVNVADVRNAMGGDPSPREGGGVLSEAAGIEVGHIFKLGTKYSEAMGLAILDESQQRQPLIMGCYGIGVGRIVAAAIELNHDKDGVIWPMSLAPYEVIITPIKFEGRVREVAEQLHDDLIAAGLTVLLDDRDERPGPKFKDADLIGIPIRLTVGEKGLAENSVEFVRRGDPDRGRDLVPLDAVCQRCLDTRDELMPRATYAKEPAAV